MTENYYSKKVIIEHTHRVHADYDLCGRIIHTKWRVKEPQQRTSDREGLRCYRGQKRSPNCGPLAVS